MKRKNTTKLIVTDIFTLLKGWYCLGYLTKYIIEAGNITDSEFQEPFETFLLWRILSNERG